MRQRLEQIGTYILVLCAIVSTGAFVQRSYFPMGARKHKTATYVENWEGMRRDGRQLSNPGAPVTVIELGDYECPGCGFFSHAMSDELERAGARISMIFIHAPSPTHPFAMPAARAAECASQQERFAPYHDLLFTQQDSLGLKSWLAFAKDAGVPDIAKFDTCLRDAASPPLLARGMNQARRIGLKVTPTIIINGWQLSWTPSQEELHRMIELAAAERSLSERKLLSAAR